MHPHQFVNFCLSMNIDHKWFQTIVNTTIKEVEELRTIILLLCNIAIFVKLYHNNVFNTVPIDNSSSWAMAKLSTKCTRIWKAYRFTIALSSLQNKAKNVFTFKLRKDHFFKLLKVINVSFTDLKTVYMLLNAKAAPSLLNAPGWSA